MSTRFDRIAIPLLTRIVKGQKMGFQQVSAAKQGLYVARKPPRRGTKPAAARKAAKATSHRESTGAIREAVFARAEGGCEAIYRADGGQERCDANATDLDHWLNGIGRRRQKQSVETCWALCGTCHRMRTRGAPSVGFWNEIFRRHCEDYGYPFTPHIVHASLRPAPAAAQTPLGHSGSEAGGTNEKG